MLGKKSRTLVFSVLDLPVQRLYRAADPQDGNGENQHL